MRKETKMMTRRSGCHSNQLTPWMHKLSKSSWISSKVKAFCKSMTSMARLSRAPSTVLRRSSMYRKKKAKEVDEQIEPRLTCWKVVDKGLTKLGGTRKDWRMVSALPFRLFLFQIHIVDEISNEMSASTSLFWANTSSYQYKRDRMGQDLLTTPRRMVRLFLLVFRYK